MASATASTTADAINAVINNTVDKLGSVVHSLTPIAQAAFSLYVKQAVINGWLTIVGGVLFMAFGVGLLLTGAELSKNGEYHEEAGGFYFFGGIALIAGLVSALFFGMPRLLNPEMFAVQAIVSQVHQ